MREDAERKGSQEFQQKKSRSGEEKSCIGKWGLWKEDQTRGRGEEAKFG